MRLCSLVSIGFVSSLLIAGCSADPASSGTGGAGGTSSGNGSGTGGATAASGTGTGIGGGFTTSTASNSSTVGSGSGTGGTGGATTGSGGTGGAGGSGGCAAGTEDCNNDPVDGCETDTWGSPDNCGGCGVICPSGPGGTPFCSSGICGLLCAQGTGNCNMDPADGCETDFINDPQHCGGCTTDCMGATCVQGACACAAETQQADFVPLDLFIMQDQSGSMSDTVQGGGTKWDATKTAFTGFFNDPANAGLGVGIQYFALPDNQGCPSSCSSNADCGPLGICFLSNCILCGFGGGDSCNVADYAKAEVPIAPLSPAQAMALSNSINAHSPSGGTPTGPALSGAIEYAKTWKGQNPSHNVVVVLATDGNPSGCSPSDIPSIANIAAAGANGNPSIKTFVIGVGSSLSNLNAIAMAGGTGSAFLVDTNANVVQQFQAALMAIQQTALGCEYTIPQPQMGMIDYNKVNVQYTPGNGMPPQVIGNVADAASCDPVNGGWYYDNPLMPAKIILCPATCNVVQADPTGKIDILLGCMTQHM